MSEITSHGRTVTQQQEGAAPSGAAYAARRPQGRGRVGRQLAPRPVSTTGRVFKIR